MCSNVFPRMVFQCRTIDCNSITWHGWSGSFSLAHTIPYLHTSTIFVLCKSVCGKKGSVAYWEWVRIAFVIVFQPVSVFDSLCIVAIKLFQGVSSNKLSFNHFMRLITTEKKNEYTSTSRKRESKTKNWYVKTAFGEITENQNKSA